MGVGVRYHLDQQRPFFTQAALEATRKIGGIRDSNSRAAASFGNLSMIDIREAAGGGEAAELDGFSITLVSEDCLLRVLGTIPAGA